MKKKKKKNIHCKMQDVVEREKEVQILKNDFFVS